MIQGQSTTINAIITKLEHNQLCCVADAQSDTSTEMALLTSCKVTLCLVVPACSNKAKNDTKTCFEGQLMLGTTLQIKL